MTLATLRSYLTPQVIDRTLIIITLVCLGIFVTAAANGQDAKQSLLLTAEEVTSLDKIQRELQNQNQKEAVAAQVIVDCDADNLDAVTLAALKYRKIALDGRKALSSNFSAWLAKTQADHKCKDCTLSKDGKSLENPPQAEAKK